jgi:8-oxo-dGTP pyrophosphatase MutT (NUDIX family)
MQHELAFGRHFVPPYSSSSEAGVLIVLHPHNNAWHFPLVSRPVSLSRHGGQVSLPGGLCHTEETAEQAAWRETEEELGLPANSLITVGSLSPLYVYGSDCLVRPYVATLDIEPVYAANADEVDEYFLISLGELAAAAPQMTLQRRCELEFSAPAFVLGDRTVWGATAMILREFQAILQDVLP